MVLKPNSKREKFTIVDTEDGHVTGFGDYAKPLTEDEIRDTEHEIITPLMFTGIHIMRARGLRLHSARRLFGHRSGVLQTRTVKGRKDSPHT